MTPADRVLTLARRVETLIAAGKLRGVREPVNVSIFAELPPVEMIETRQVYRSAAPGSVHDLFERVRKRKV